MHNTEITLTSSTLQAFPGVIATRYHTEVKNVFMLSNRERKKLRKVI